MVYDLYCHHTGFLVLKELGFVVDKYVASEIDMDAVNVSSVCT